MDSAKKQKAIKALFDYVEQLTQKLASREARTEMVLEQLTNEQQNYNQHLAAVSLYGPECKIQIKVYFMYEDAKKLVAGKINRPASEVSDRMAIDFFKEQCNVIAGQIQNQLHDMDIEMGHSIPFAVQGYNEVFFSYESDEIARYVFKLSSNLGMSIYSVEFDVTDDDLMSKFAQLKYKEEKKVSGAFQMV